MKQRNELNVLLLSYFAMLSVWIVVASNGEPHSRVHFEGMFWDPSLIVELKSHKCKVVSSCTETFLSVFIYFGVVLSPLKRVVLETSYPLEQCNSTINHASLEGISLTRRYFKSVWRYWHQRARSLLNYNSNLNKNQHHDCTSKLFNVLAVKYIKRREVDECTEAEKGQSKKHFANPKKYWESLSFRQIARGGSYFFVSYSRRGSHAFSRIF